MGDEHVWVFSLVTSQTRASQNLRRDRVRRFLDPAHQHYGELKGLYQYPGLQPLVKVVRPVWMDHLDNKISREEAIKQIVDGFLKLARKRPPNFASHRPILHDRGLPRT